MANYSNNLGQIRLGWRTAPVFTPDGPGTPNTIDPDSTNFILASGISDSLQISAIETLVSDLKAYGLWTKMKAIYPFVGGSAASHKFNLKDPRNLDAAYRLVFNGGWIHSSNGAKPNGSTGYADTFFNPSTNLSNSTISNHLSTYIRENIDELKVDIGLFSGSNGLGWDIETRISNTAYYPNLRGNNYITFVNTDSRGLHINTRTTSTSQKVFINSTLKGTDTGSTTGTINSNVSIAARYNTFNSSYEYRSSKEQAFVSIGDGLTDTDASNLYISVQKFQTTLGRHVGTPYVSDPDAIAFLIAAGITDGTQAAAINTLVIRMKADGVWTKMKAIYPFVGGNSTSHKFNLKDPRDLDSAYRLVFNGGWVHSSTGALPNGTTGYADTKLNVLSVLTANNNHITYYSRTNDSTSNRRTEMGIESNFGINNINMRLLLTGYWGITNSFIFGAGNATSGGGVSSTNTDSRGFYQGNILSSSNRKAYKNGILVGSNTSLESQSLANGNMYIGCTNVYDVPRPFDYTNKEVSFSSIGDGLTDTEATSFYAAVQAYQTTLGRQVNIPLVSDTDAQSFLNAANITSFQQASAVNKLVVDLKAAGVWSKMKAIYPFVGGSAASHKFNLKDPRDLDAAYRLVFNGGWTHTGTGALPNGTTAYANTKLIPSTVFGAQNPILHYSIYNRTSLPITSTQWSDGVYSLTGIGGISLMQNSFTTLASGNSSVLVGSSDPIGTLTGFSNNTDGNFVFSRTSNTSLKAYRNGTLVGTKTTDIGSDTYVPRTEFLIGARNDSYDMALRPFGFNPLEKTFTSIGDGLTDAEATSLYTAVQSYQTSLGRQVTTPIYNNGLVLNLDAGNANSYPGTGTTWFDLASGNNGTITNGPTYDTTNGGSLLFDGVNDFSGHPIINFGTSSVSWSFWIKPSRYVSTFESFIGQGMYNVNGGGMLYGGLRNDTGTRRIQFSISSDPNAVNGKTVILDNSYTINTWTNIVVTYNSSNRDLFLYINGVKQNATTNTTGNFGNTSISQNLSPTNTTGRMLSLCMYDESRTNGVFSGNMATTQIYFRSLSDTEVLNYFNSTRGRFGL